MIQQNTIWIEALAVVQPGLRQVVRTLLDW